MIRREVVYAPEAEADLMALYDRIAAVASPDIALNYASRLAAWLDDFDVAAERGTRRDDLRPDLRVVGFERRVTVAFAVIQDRAVILRLFYGGQDWSRFFTG